MSDPLDDLLTPRPIPDDGAMLRRQILAQITGLLRRRRRLKQAAWAVALAACYGAGLVTMHLFAPAPAVQIVYRDRDPEPKTDTPREPQKETPPETAVAVENRALDATDRRERGELYRKAAELYHRNGDYANWVRCRGNALDEARQEDLAVLPDDDSVTIALKLERQKKENRDARNLD